MAESECKSYHHLRSDIRFPTDFRAILHWGDNFSCVQVANIANSGMRFIGRVLPEQNEKVRVSAKGLEIEGRVVWRTADSCAVVLEHAINSLAVVRANCFAHHLVVEDKHSLDRISRAEGRRGLGKTLPVAPRHIGMRRAQQAGIVWRAVRPDVEMTMA